MRRQAGACDGQISAMRVIHPRLQSRSTKSGWIVQRGSRTLQIIWRRTYVDLYRLVHSGLGCLSAVAQTCRHSSGYRNRVVQP
jgi:hypothetical protein